MRTHVYPLDALRFFAALSVLFYHLGYFGWSNPYSTVGRMWAGATTFHELAPYTWFGWIGVQIFFVISGFVIANSANGASPIGFAKSRALRLYPAVWLCAPVTFALLVVAGGQGLAHEGGELVRSLSLWPLGPWVDGVYWTLAVELVFYALVFALLLSGKFAHLRTLAWGLLTLSGAYLAATLVFGGSLESLSAWRFLVANAGLLQVQFGAFFALGIWFWFSSAKAMKKSDWAGIALALVVGAIEIAGVGNSHSTERAAPAWWLAPELIWFAAVTVVFIAARAPARFAPRSPRLQALFKHAGQMTYPLYLTHSVCGAFVVRAAVHAGLDRWLALTLAVALSLSFAYFIARIGEPAVRKGLRWLLERGEAGLRRAPHLSFLFRPGGQAAKPLG